jgi:hypothetical protein
MIKLKAFVNWNTMKDLANTIVVNDPGRSELRMKNNDIIIVSKRKKEK